MLCHRLSYPGKWSRLRKTFSRSNASCCRIVLDLVDFLIEEWGDLLYFNDVLYAVRHEEYCKVVEEKTQNMVSRISMFIDGTKCAICRPTAVESLQQRLDVVAIGDAASLQRVCYSGHKRKHCLNFQGVNTPDGIKTDPVMNDELYSLLFCAPGLCIAFFGPVEGRRHDSTMLRMSRLLDYIREHPVLSRLGICIYGDPAYGTSDLICSPFRGAHLTEEQAIFNKTMSGVRVSIEWFFGIVKRSWAFIDWNKKHKILLSPVAKMVKVSVLLANCRTCIKGGNQISEFFNCSPPTLEDYLGN